METPTGRRRNMTFVDLMGGAPGDRDWQFCAQCSPIYVLYTFGLHAAKAKLKAASSWSRIMPGTEPWEPKPDGWTPISSTAWAFATDGMTRGGSDPIFVMVDPAMPAFGLRGRPRAEWYFEWLDGLLRDLAAYRRWDAAALDEARRYCLDKNLEARFDSKWRLSPDRTMKAGASLFIDEEGDRHVTLKVARRNDEVVASTTETFEPFFVDFYTWRTMARQIRWISPTTVVIDDGLQLGGYPRVPGPTEIALEIEPAGPGP